MASNRHRLFLLALLLALPLAILARDNGTPSILQGRVIAPPEIDTTELRVLLHEAGISSIENDPVAFDEASVQKDGSFEIEKSGHDNPELEIVGKGIRRARFPWPSIQDGVAEFRAESGRSIDGSISDKDGNPIPGAVLGPIVPDIDATPSVMRKAYPFFVRADASGNFTIEGLQLGTGYGIPVFAPGYQRRTFPVTPTESNLEIVLAKGGIPLSVRVAEELSLEPAPGIIVTAENNAASMTIERRTDAQGMVEFDGLPPGNWMLFAKSEDSDLIRPEELSLIADASNPIRTILLPGPVTASGTLVDGDTGEGLSNRLLLIGTTATRTGSGGTFEVRSPGPPWPAKIILEEPGYRLDETSVQQVDPRGDMEIQGIVLVASKIRYLELELPSNNLSFPATLHFLKNGPEEENLHRRISDLPVVYPFMGVAPRIAYIQDSAGAASPIVVVRPEVGGTTETLTLNPGPGASIQATVAYRSDDMPLPIVGSTLSLATPDTLIGEEIEILRASEREGSIYVSGLPPGQFVATFTTSEKTILHRQSITLTSGETNVLDILVEPGNTLEGIVVGPEETPLPEIEVSVYATDPTGAPLHLKTMTKQDGSFRFERIGGRYDSVRISHWEYDDFESGPGDLPGEPLRIELTRKGGLVVELVAPLYEAQSAAAILMLGVTQLAPDGTRQWFSNEISRSRFRDGLETTVIPPGPGRYRVAVETAGKWGVSEAFDWPDSGLERISVTPGSDATVTAKITGTNDGAAGFSAVLINTTLPENQAKTEFQPTAISADEIRFGELPAGDYLLLADTSEGAVYTVSNLDLSRGEHLDVSIAAEMQYVELGGFVLGIAGTAKVSLYFADVPEGSVLAETTTDDDGRFTFEQLLAKRPYIVEVTAGDRTERFPMQFDSTAQGLQVREFRLESKRAVMLVPTGALVAQIASQPNAPIVLLPAGGGNSMIVSASNLAAPIMLKPGAYRAAWGEMTLADIQVPPGDGSKPVVVELRQ